MGIDQVVAIRDAKAADAEALAQLHAASWRATYRGILRDHYLDHEVLADRLAVWRDRFEHPKASQRIFVAENIDSGEIAGLACCFIAEDERYGTWLDNLHISPERKRGGLGTTLIRRIAAASLEASPEAGLWLLVFEGNTEARNFYERLGGVNTGSEMIRTYDGTLAKMVHMYWADPRGLR
jgi:ribosomal protein S18 acetylase RimI-like enzyme